jgi:hypothetical protein
MFGKFSHAICWGENPSGGNSDEDRGAIAQAGDGPAFLKHSSLFTQQRRRDDCQLGRLRYVPTFIVTCTAGAARPGRK